MTDSRLLLLAGTLVASSLSACALDDGDPWGRADFNVVIAYAGDADRASQDGGLLTSTGFRVEVERVEARVATAAITVAANGSGATSFDPAEPPEGYSLCHNGHCHADDGSLVDYEDIEAQLAGGASAGGTQVVQAIDALAPLRTEPTPLPLDVCSNDCELPRGELALAELVVTQWHVEATVFDTRTDNPRVPVDGLSLDLVIDEPSTFSSAVSGTVGKGESVDVDLEFSLIISNRLFDGIEFGELDLTTDPSELAATIESASTFEITLSR